MIITILLLSNGYRAFAFFKRLLYIFSHLILTKSLQGILQKFAEVKTTSEELKSGQRSNVNCQVYTASKCGDGMWTQVLWSNHTLSLSPHWQFSTGAGGGGEVSKPHMLKTVLVLKNQCFTTLCHSVKALKARSKSHCLGML